MNTPSSVAPLAPDSDRKSDSFLPSLKGYAIDGKYKHYGHVDKDKRKPPLRLLLVLSHNPLTLPLEPPHDALARSLDLPADKYSEETVHELLRLRIEQEKTKQAQMKCELSRAVLDLMREAELRGFGSDVLRRLFVVDDDELRAQLLQLGAPGCAPKRKLSDPAPSSALHLVHTPLPNKLPMGPLQPLAASAAPLLALLARLAARPHATTPQQPLVYPKHVYPVYYAQVPEHYPPEDGEQPYDPQKYPPVVFHQLPQYTRHGLLLGPGPSQPTPPQQQHLPAQPHQNLQRPYYYVNSPPGMPGPMVPSLYFIPPLLAPGMVPWTIAPAPQKKDDEHHHKKPKPAKSGINFMITTPKNPPARKYNKL